MKKKTDRRSLWIVVLLVAALILAVPIKKGLAKQKQSMELYEQAVALYDSGSYKEANELFLDLPDLDFRDARAYIDLCSARIAYGNRNIAAAHFYIGRVRLNGASREQYEALKEFKALLDADYEVYLKEKAIADERAYRERITKGVPFVGMREAEIRNTSLGAPSDKVRHNTEMKNGQPHRANLYDFKKGNATIFTARCVDGYVTEVWDHRDNPLVPYVPEKSTKLRDDDPFDVNDYVHPDDFYYDHYDDFFDYEDAEDYYYKHRK